MIQSQQFRAVRRPKDLSSPYALVVVDGSGVPHLPLTEFYHEIQRFLAEGTAKTYLATLLPYFDYLVTDSWRQEREDRWDSPPDAVRESVRDFLVEQLHCKAQPRETDQLVRLTGKSPSTVHVFLCALKQFYYLARRKEWYLYPHPLTDPTAKLLQDIEAEERRVAGHRPRMPQRSGVEEPRQRFISDNYFKLVHETWQPHPIDDPQLHRVLRQGFPRAGLCLRDQLVVRIAYESGARIREILRLTIGDWRKRGGKQEAWAFSKGSHGRRVKIIRWSAETTRMLLAYVNTERMAIDRKMRRLDALDDGDPLFLSRRGNPYDYDSFKKHWYKLCAVLQLDHKARQIYQALGIEKQEIEKRQSWQNYIETCFNVQRRMADWYFETAQTWEDLIATHEKWVRDYNYQKHFAHEKREDGRHSPAEVLGWVTGRQHEPEFVYRAFSAICETRVLNSAGYARFRDYLLYGERHLAGKHTLINIFQDILALEYEEHALAKYSVEWQPDDKHGARVSAIHACTIIPIKALNCPFGSPTRWNGM